MPINSSPQFGNSESLGEMQKSREAFEQALEQKADPIEVKLRLSNVLQKAVAVYESGGETSKEAVRETLAAIANFLKDQDPELYTQICSNFCDELTQHMAPEHQQAAAALYQGAFENLSSGELKERIAQLEIPKPALLRIRQADHMATLYDALASELEHGTAHETYTGWALGFTAVALGLGDSRAKASNALRDAAKFLREEGRAKILENPEQSLAELFPKKHAFLANPPGGLSSIFNGLSLGDVKTEQAFYKETARVVAALRSINHTQAADALASSTMEEEFQSSAEEERSKLSPEERTKIRLTAMQKAYTDRELNARFQEYGLSRSQIQNLVEGILADLAVETVLMNRAKTRRPSNLSAAKLPLWQQYEDMHGLGESWFDLSDETLQTLQELAVETALMALAGAAAPAILAKAGLAGMRAAGVLKLCSELSKLQSAIKANSLASTGAGLAGMTLEAGVSSSLYGVASLARHSEIIRLQLANASSWSAESLVKMAAKGLVNMAPIPGKIGGAKLRQALEVAGGIGAGSEVLYSTTEGRSEESLSTEGKVFMELMKSGNVQAAFEFMKEAIRHDAFHGDPKEVLALFQNEAASQKLSA